jgi:hypothetical protein
MIAEMPTFYPPAAIMVPEVVEQVKRRRGRNLDRRQAATGLAAGMVVLLGDGTYCQIVSIDADGTPWCVPVEQ